MATWALKDISSILSRFIEHWSAVDTALAPKSFVLRGDYGVAQLTADRTLFEANQQAAGDSVTTTETIVARRKALRESLRERIRQLRSTILGDYSDTEFANALPTIPLQTASDAIWLKALNDLEGVWRRFNATPPSGAPASLTLLGDYTYANLVADIAQLTTLAHEHKASEQASKDLNRTRDAHLETVHKKLVRYRQTLPSRLPEGHALLRSLPSLE